MPCHQYANPGTYTVTLTIVGYCHSFVSTQTCHIPRTLIVAPVNSNFSANFRTDTVCLGFVTPFFDLSIFAPDIINRTWLYDFGDGATATVYNPVHLYDSCGAYDVTLIIGGQNVCCPPSVYDTITKRVYVNCNQGSQPNALGLTDPYIYDSTLADICCGGRVSGRIITELGHPVSVATLGAVPSGQFDITDSSGNYSVSLYCGSSDTLWPSKTNDVAASNGISTADVLIIRLHILNSQLLSSPYKIIAADVNENHGISTADVLLIRQLILGNRTTFPSGSLWTFVPHNFVFADPLSPFPFPTYRYYNNIASDISGENYIGIRLGDVNGSWNPSVPKTGASGTIHFNIDEYFAQQNEMLTIPIKVQDFKRITGYQFTLSWDAGVLSLLEVKNKAVLGYYGEQRTGAGYLTTAWYDEMVQAVTLDDNAAAFDLKFKVIGANGSISPITIGSELTASEAYGENLELVNILPNSGMVKVGDSNSLNTQHSTRITQQVQPNPFANTTNIIFTLPQDETVTLSIYDILGREVKKVKAAYPAGEHLIEWSGDDEYGNLLSKGLYHVRMVAGEQSQSTKAMMLK
jgi:PKD repeat protein